MNATAPVALVFGASRGIGAACAAALKDAGWQIRCDLRHRKAGERTLLAAPTSSTCDASRRREGLCPGRSRFRRAPRLVVANAGVNTPAAPLAAFDPQHFRTLMEVTVVGAFNTFSPRRRCVPDGGAIIALTTSLVRNGAGTRHRVICGDQGRGRMPRCARDVEGTAGRGVRVNVVAPGPVDTDLSMPARPTR